MRERAASIGARLTVTSAPGAGTEVVLVLPERSGWSALWSRLVRMGGRDGNPNSSRTSSELTASFRCSVHARSAFLA